jgi:hypothetical protein
MVMLLLELAAHKSGLHGDHSTAGGAGLHRWRPERSGGRRTAAILFRDAKPEIRSLLGGEADWHGRSPAAENSR